MVRIEDILSIERDYNKRFYMIRLSNNRVIHVKSKDSILPLILLIDHERVKPVELLEIEDLPSIKTLIEKGIQIKEYLIVDNNLNLGFEKLLKDDEFTFIEERSFNGIRHYVLSRDKLDLLIYNRTIPTEEELRKEYEGLWIEQNRKCNLCGNDVNKDDFVIDYRVPIKRGGKRSKDNAQILCKSCYMEKIGNCKYCVNICNNECKLAYPECSNVIQATEYKVSKKR